MSRNWSLHHLNSQPGSSRSSRKVNRQENESVSYRYKYVFAVLTTNCCDFFLKFRCLNILLLKMSSHWAIAIITDHTTIAFYGSFFSVVMWSALWILNKFEIFLACSIIGSKGTHSFVGCECIWTVIPGYKYDQTFICVLCYLMRCLQGPLKGPPQLTQEFTQLIKLIWYHAKSGLLWVSLQWGVMVFRSGLFKSFVLCWKK